MKQPQPSQYPAWAQRYIGLVDGDVINILKAQAQSFPDFVNQHSEKADYAYANGKWTLKQLVGHMADTERILSYRLLCIARGDEQQLPGFDEDAYVSKANFATRSIFAMAKEFSYSRKANLLLIQSLSDGELDRMGTANNQSICARALVYVLAGHVIHHQNIIKERYL